MKTLTDLGLNSDLTLHYQPTPDELILDTLRIGEGVLNDTGAVLKVYER
jgi:phosphoenolpyruvate carboxykinase (ATP)